MRRAAAASQWVTRSRADVAIAAICASVSAIFVFFLAGQVHPSLYFVENSLWTWFEADLNRVYTSMISRGAETHRTNVHPLYAAVMYVPTKALLLLGVPERLAATLYLSAVGAGFSASFYALSRCLGHLRADSALLTTMIVSTSASIFWLPIAEVHGLGGLSIVLGMTVMLAASRRANGAILQSVGSAITLAISSTNWMLGLLMAYRLNSLPRAIRISMDGLLIVTVLFAVQKLFIPKAQFFVPNIGNELDFVLHELGGGPLQKVRTMLAYGVVLPEIGIEWFAERGQTRTTVQLQPLSRLSGPGMVALALWLMLLARGTWVAVISKRHWELVSAVLLYLAFQVVLHLFYGEELFVFSMNYVPAMVVLASFAFFGTHARLARGALVALTALSLYANVGEYVRVTGLIWQSEESMAVTQ